MITDLNLASRPFRNRALPWTIAISVATISLIALALTLAEWTRVRAQEDQTGRDLAILRNQVEALRQQAAQVRDSLSPEQIAAVQSAHMIIARKRFSWSQLFSDLEAHTPANVRVTRIKVRDVAQRGDRIFADLEISVIGRASDDVTAMIAELNAAGFNIEPIAQRPRQGRGASGIEWTFRLRYTPRSTGVETGRTGDERS
jgi:Tfp pilus assembly protein PilN